MARATAQQGRRERARRAIFEADTPAGKAFGVVLLALIVCSVLLVMIESVPGCASAAPRCCRCRSTSSMYVIEDAANGFYSMFRASTGRSSR